MKSGPGSKKRLKLLLHNAASAPVFLQALRAGDVKHTLIGESILRRIDAFLRNDSHIMVN